MQPAPLRRVPPKGRISPFEPQETDMKTNEEYRRLEQQLAEREKQIVELREALVKISNEQVVNTTSFQIATKALAATKDLSGLVLCDAEPVAFVSDDGELIEMSRLEQHHFIDHKLYARKQP
jgi:hypothetical protein